MADVFEIRGDALGNRLALKLLQRTLLDQPKVVARFRREGQLQSGLHHRCIARVFDLIEHAGRPGLVMEFIDAPTLRQWLDRGTASASDVRRLAVELLEGLQVAHKRGVVHRDLKPSNVFVLGSGPTLTVKIIDFGIAKAPDRGDEDRPAALTQLDEYVGTYAYSSPEQLLQAASVDPRSDLFSLGVVLWEALSGIPPWPGTKVPAHVMAAVVDEALPDLPADVPDDLQRLVLELTRKGPDERPQSAAEALNSLRAPAAGLRDATVGFSTTPAAGPPAPPDELEGVAATRVVPKLDRAEWTPISAAPTPSPAVSPPPRRDARETNPTVVASPGDDTDAPVDPRERALTELAPALPSVGAPLGDRLLAHAVDLVGPLLCLATCVAAPGYLAWLLARGVRDGQSLGQLRGGTQLVDAQTGLPLDGPQRLRRNAWELLVWHGPLGAALWPGTWLTFFPISILLLLYCGGIGLYEVMAVGQSPTGQRLVDRLASTRVVTAP